MPKCPKEMITTCFLYLERIDKEGKLRFKSADDIKKLIDLIKNNTKDFVEQVAKFENQKKEFPNEPISFTLSTKSNISAVNYIETKKDATKSFSDPNKVTKLTVDTKHDVNVELELFSLDSTSEHIEKELSKIELSNSDAQRGSILCFYDDGFLGSVNLYNSLESIMDAKGKICDAEDLRKFAENYIALASELTTVEEVKVAGATLKGLVVFNDFSDEEIMELVPERLNGILEIEDVRETLEFWKKREEDSFKRALIELPSIRQEKGIKAVASLLSGFSGENMDQIRSLDKLESFDVQLNYKTSELPELLVCNKSRESKVFYMVPLKVSKKELKDSLVEKQSVEMLPDRLNIDISTNDIQVKIDFDDERDVDLIPFNSAQGEFSHFYSSDFLKKHKVLAIDESDNASKGNRAVVMRNIAKYADVVTSATGTGITTGKSSGVAYTQATSGNIEDPKIVADTYKERCGIFEIKNPYIKKLHQLMATDKSIESEFLSIAKSLSSSKANKEQNTYKVAQSFVSKSINVMKLRDDIYVEELNTLDATKVMSQLLKGYQKPKMWNSLDKSNGTSLLKSTLFTDTKFLKETVGISPIKEFTSMLKGYVGNFGITTRENLTGLSEKLNFKDLGEHFSNLERIKKSEDVSDLYEKNLLYPKAVESMISIRSINEFTTNIYHILNSNFEEMIKAVSGTDRTSKNNLKIITPEGMVATDFLYDIARSGTQTKDGMQDLYKAYLQSNGDTSVIPEEKRELFNHCVAVFEKVFISKHIEGLDVDEQFRKFSMGEIFVPEKISNIFGDEVQLGKHFYYENGYPYIAESCTPVQFSYDAILRRNYGGEIQKDIEYRFMATNTTSKEVIDLFSSLGREKQIADSVNKGENFIVTSSRIRGLMSNLMSVIDSASKREKRDDPITILVVKNAENSKFVKELQSDFHSVLQKNNINLELSEANGVANEVKKLDSKKLQYAVFGSYKSISRGLDLSNTDIMHITDALTDPSETMQLLARGFNPAKGITESNVTLFGGGTNIGISIDVQKKEKALEAVDMILGTTEFSADGKMILDDNPDKESLVIKMIEDGLVKCKPTYSDLINRDSVYESFRIYKEAMSGVITNTELSSLNDIIVFTSSFEKSIQAKMEENRDVSFDEVMQKLG